jgi:hypothetical protein
MISRDMTKRTMSSVGKIAVRQLTSKAIRERTWPTVNDKNASADSAFTRQAIPSNATEAT